KRGSCCYSFLWTALPAEMTLSEQEVEINTFQCKGTDTSWTTSNPLGLISRERETRPETCIGLSDQESRNSHRKIKEAVHIQLEDAKLNRTEGWELPKTYLPLLRREAAGGGTQQTDASLGPSLALSRD
ncbi:hypothetical protein Bbelb_439740, partial [Branchiostoma belcheri]